MIELKINEEEVRELYLEKLEMHISKMDTEKMFWDTRELERQTSMCYNTIQKEFFYHPDFKKHRIGNKFYYEADATRKFLHNWIKSK